MTIIIENISKSFSTRQVLFEVTLTVNRGEIVTIMGENGCGKTTLFNIVAGLLEPDEGSVSINGQNPREVFPSIVFQDYRESLFPWLTVRQNIEFAYTKSVKSGKRPPFETEGLIEALGIKDLADRYPHELSGGEAQLVGIARALAFGSEVVLLDEPSSSLSFDMEQRFHEVLLKYREKMQATVLLISHDPREAVHISNKVVVLSKNPARVIRCLDIKPGYYNEFLNELIRLLRWRCQ
jgi:NitT/TauT family transport system ATP-binding protein